MTRQSAEERRDLHRARFKVNMARIDALLGLLLSEAEELEGPWMLMPLKGVRGDLFRAIVVFLHATFESALRHAHPSGKLKSAYTVSKFRAALKRADIDPVPFELLFVPLVQMAKRRNDIVHHADMRQETARDVRDWGFADTWQLILWVFVVKTFHYQLRVLQDPTSPALRFLLEQNKSLVAQWYEFGKRFVEVMPADQERRKAAIPEFYAFFQKMLDTLQPDEDATRAKLEALIRLT
jgi:hypothetical protein